MFDIQTERTSNRHSNIISECGNSYTCFINSSDSSEKTTNDISSVWLDGDIAFCTVSHYMYVHVYERLSTQMRSYHVN